MTKPCGGPIKPRSPRNSWFAPGPWTCACVLLGGMLTLLSGCGAYSAPEVSANLNDAEVIRNELQGGAGGAVAAAVADPTGWANLKGSFKLNGSPPALTKLDVTQDKSVCQDGSSPVFDVNMKVDDATKGIQDIVIFMTTKIPDDSTMWINAQYADAETKVLAGSEGFDQKKCVFLSRLFTMQVNQKVEILNSDPVGHNTNIPYLGFNETIPPGGKIELQPSKVAKLPMPVSCAIHPWMKAYFFTHSNPYFAGSGEQGTFLLENVPAGVEIEFRIWHERAGFVSGDVQLNGSTVKLKSGRYKVTLEPGVETELNFVLDASLFE